MNTFITKASSMSCLPLSAFFILYYEHFLLWHQHIISFHFTGITNACKSRCSHNFLCHIIPLFLRLPSRSLPPHHRSTPPHPHPTPSRTAVICTFFVRADQVIVSINSGPCYVEHAMPLWPIVDP